MKKSSILSISKILIVFALLITACKDDEVMLLTTTLPVELERSLIESNLPYELDGFGGAYHPMQLNVKFKAGVDQATRNDILINKLGAVSVRDCMCGDVLSLAIFDQNGLGEGGLEGVKQRGDEENEIEELSFNYYNFTQQLTFTPPTIVSQAFPSILQSEIMIAVLDVGLDYGSNTTINGFLAGNSAESTIDNDDDDIPANCLNDDFTGWDFANEDNDPTDDHSHGTHVTNTIYDQLFIVDPTGLLTEKTSFLPVKTHNQEGVGTLFNVSCGIIYAASRQADIINASWGFYSEEVPEVLQGAIEFANALSGTIFVTSAGNESKNLDNENHFPSDFANTHDYVISVGSFDSDGITKADFSNYYANQSQNILAPGVNILATMPMWHTPSQDIKTGTSMSAAAISAAVADVINTCGTIDGSQIKDHITGKLTQQNLAIGADNIDFVNYIPDSISCL